jgi:hypothetical protein
VRQARNSSPRDRPTLGAEGPAHGGIQPSVGLRVGAGLRGGVFAEKSAWQSAQRLSSLYTSRRMVKEKEVMGDWQHRDLSLTLGRAVLDMRDERRGER